MTIKQAQQELTRALVFGDELQIKALKVLNNVPNKETIEDIEMLLSDWKEEHMSIEKLIGELQYILGNHLTH